MTQDPVTPEERGGRAYQIGKNVIEIPYDAVEKIIEWNENPQCQDIRYDRKICYLLLLSLVPKEDLRVFNVGKEVMRFIKGSFSEKLFRLLFIFEFSEMSFDSNTSLVRLSHCSMGWIQCRTYDFNRWIQNRLLCRNSW